MSQARKVVHFMKYATMVMKAGNIKDKPSLMNYTLIGDDLSIHTMTGAKLEEVIKSKKITVTNMAVNAQGLTSTNGSIKNYTTIGMDGAIVGKPRCVILARKEVDGKLNSFLVFNINGAIGFMSPAQAAKLAEAGLIANGKVRHTNEGDVVSAIGGTYPLYEEKTSKAKASKSDKITIDVVFFGSALGDDNVLRYAGVITTGKNAAVMARLHKVLKEANEKLQIALKDRSGYTKKQMDNLSIKMAPGAGFYGVYPLSKIKGLIESSGGCKASVRTVMIGCTDCTKDGDNSESIIFYDTKDKKIIKTIDATEKANAGAKEYYNYVVEKYLK